MTRHISGFFHPFISHARILAAVLLCLFAGMLHVPPAAAQESSLGPRSFMTPAVVFREEGSASAGFLEDVRGDSVLLLSRGERIAIPFSAMRKVQLPQRSNAHKAALDAMFLGAYVSDILIWPARDRPGFYAYTKDLSVLFVISNLTFAFLSSGIAYLVTMPREIAEQHFLFTGDTGQRRAEERRFLAFVREHRHTSRLHLSVLASVVRPLQTSRAARFYSGAGVGTSMQVYVESYKHEDQPFNLLRKGQITYDVLPMLGVGAAYMNLSESVPEQRNIASERDFSHRVTIRHTLDAALAVVSVEPLRGLPNDRWSLHLGAGAGAAFSRGAVDATTTGTTIPSSYLLEQHASLDATLPCVTGFAELRARLTSLLSLGLTGEYTVVQSLDVVPFEGISSGVTTLDFSSWSWGITLGMHF